MFASTDFATVGIAAPLAAGLGRIDQHAPRQSRPRLDLRARLVMLDVLAVTVSWTAVVAWGRHGAAVEPSLASTGVAVASTLAALASAGRYLHPECGVGSSRALRSMAACAVGGLVYVMMQRSLGAGGGLVTAIEGAAVSAAALAVLRWSFDRWVRECRSRGRFLRSVVLVGANADAEDLWTMMTSEPEIGYSVELVVAGSAPHRTWERADVVEGVERIPELARLVGADGVVVVPNALSSEEFHHVVRAAVAEGLQVHLCPGLRGLGSRRLRPVSLSGEATFQVRAPAASCVDRGLKRCIDLVVGTLILLVAAPVLAVAAAAIKLQDRGPVLLRQERVGRDGAVFSVFKLRTMVPDAESMQASLASLNERTDGPLFKARVDPRVTPAGRLLRATSIDEIPQLLNVLAGTMSLVGPRPALAEEVGRFDDETLRRLTVLPGMTGLWQIEARDNPSFNAYRRLDLLYVDNWSLSLDISILVATVPAVLAHALKSLAEGRRARSTEGDVR